MMVICMLFFTYFIAQLTTAIIDAASRRRWRERQLDAARAYIKEHRVSPGLGSRIVRCIRHAGSLQKSGASVESQLLSLMSFPLKRSLLCEVRSAVVFNSLLFEVWARLHGRSFERICCDVLQPREATPNETIFSWGEQAQSIGLYRQAFAHTPISRNRSATCAPRHHEDDRHCRRNRQHERRTRRKIRFASEPANRFLKPFYGVAGIIKESSYRFTKPVIWNCRLLMSSNWLKFTLRCRIWPFSMQRSSCKC